MELIATGFLPWKGSFATLKNEAAFKSLVKSNDYVVAVDAKHCVPTKSGKAECRQGFHIDTYDCVP